MNHAFSYEVNQLGGGRWQRAFAPAYAAADDVAPSSTVSPRWDERHSPLRRRLSVVLGLALVFVATVLLGIASQHVAASLSDYRGVSGSYLLVMGLSGTAPFAISAPPAALAVPTATSLTPAAPAPATTSANPAVLRHPAAGDYQLLGAPSISVAAIEQVLKQYNSPAIGNGQAFYDLGVKYGVDPAFMLAFYVHESAAGTMGAAVATKSVGNIICAGWSGNCIGRFRAYDSYAQAAEDWYQLITGPLYIGAGLDTPEQITPRYAPDSDNNDSSGYAQTVERLVDQWRASQEQQ